MSPLTTSPLTSEKLTSEKTSARGSDDRVVLTVNGGSSSIKFAVFSSGAPPRRLLGGRIERIGDTGTRLIATGDPPAPPEIRPVDAADHRRAAACLIAYLSERLGPAALAGVGHRVVH